MRNARFSEIDRKDWTVTQALRRTTVPRPHLIGASAPEQSGIVHLGLGNFHRAHMAVYTAKALQYQYGNWGINAYSHSSSRMVEPMRAQDNLYTVLNLTNQGIEPGIVDVHRGLGIATSESEKVVEDIALGSHQIVSLTVSEFGYSRSALTGGLDLDDEGIRADLDPRNSPKTTIGMIARGLEKRAENGDPLTVLSCDNLQASGNTTREIILDFLAAANVHSDVQKYLETNVTFPNAMVDRIVPQTTDAHREIAAKLLSVRDEAPVPAEEFSMWVLEDNFAAGRPAWDLAGATFSHEVHAYEMVKLRLLNGSHSLIAYLGILSGSPTIKNAWDQQHIRDVVLLGMEKDYLPTFTPPTGFNSEEYIHELSARWSNSLIAHKTTQVGSDGSQKLLQRVPEAALFNLKKGKIPHTLALCVAAWIAVVCPPSGAKAPALAQEVREPNAHRLKEATSNAHGLRNHVDCVLRGGFFPDELGIQHDFSARVTELLEMIIKSGPKDAAEHVVQSYASKAVKEI